MKEKKKVIFIHIIFRKFILICNFFLADSTDSTDEVNEVKIDQTKDRESTKKKSNF